MSDILNQPPIIQRDMRAPNTHKLSVQNITPVSEDVVKPLSYVIQLDTTLSGYSKAKLIAHLEKSLNAFIAKTKKEEVL